MMEPDPKREHLRAQGLLNPNPQVVHAPWFQSGDFFDANDSLQTKYEMLRHVRVDGATKAQAAALFGMSRPTFYQAEAAFSSDGLAGLLPKQRGPKGAHKLTDQVMTFIEQKLQADGAVHARALAQEIQTTLGFSVHPRTIERAIERKKNADGYADATLAKLKRCTVRDLAFRFFPWSGLSRRVDCSSVSWNVARTEGFARDQVSCLCRLAATHHPAISQRHPIRSTTGQSCIARSIGGNPCLLIDSRR